LLITLLIAVFVVSILAGSILGVPLGIAFVETGSMSSTMDPSDGFIALPPALLGGVSEGDIVTFDARQIENGRLTTHRVVGKTPEGYITRGDANPFNDQQAGEPPIPRDRIVAEALQINGQVIVIPNLGDFVGSVRGIFAFIGTRFGLSVNQVIAFVIVGALAAYLLDESDMGSEKRIDRSTDRPTGFSGLLFIGGAVAVMLAAATLSMTAASGAIALPYDSVAPGDASQGGIPAGTTQSASVELTNGGLVPMTAVLSTDDPNATLAQERVYLGPQSNATVNVSITAPAEPGEYEVSVERQQYLAVLPGGVLSTLSSAGHWLAVAVVDLLLAGVVAAFGAALVGGGRVRLRPRRAVPTEVGLLRWVRSLYTRR
jgi:signal peptidase